MVIGDTNGAAAATTQPVPQPQFSGATIDNIMHGIENTGTVKMNNHRKKLRQRFDIIKKLGQGTYGKVQLGINKETGQEVAIKTIKKSKIETEADLIRIRREVQIMSSVQHPNIIHIYEVFENREKMVLVMEFAAGGELYDYLSERKVLTEEEARRIFRQVATAIYYCHKHKICHRDLKLENILLDEHGNAKIADFGLSNVFDEQRLLATFCGSPLYASPEIVKGTPYLGPEVDCWSLGVLLYTLVYGAMPFDGANFKRLVKQISMGDYFEPKKPSRASPLIREMLTVCPKRRANIENICNHWWVNETYNESCLTLAEELANQTPVRLDVLLSLAPPSVTADQLVVAAMEPETSGAGGDRLQKSHSVGSVIDIGGTEAERRIIDMVQAGGEAALMPSPTRTITPQESPAQPKRKLEPTVSMENATGAARKKDKPTEEPIPETMDTETSPEVKEKTQEAPADASKDLAKIDKMCDELLKPAAEEPKQQAEPKKEPTPKKEVEKPKESLPAPKAAEVATEKKSPARKVFNKGKTSDLSGTIDKATTEVAPKKEATPKPVERKNSLPENNGAGERRKSRILETAEKFQSMNNQNNEKYKKFVIPGVSVGSFKKEFERKASITPSTIGPMERKQRNSESASRQNSQEDAVNADSELPALPQQQNKSQDKLKESDSKSSVGSFSLEDARKSMENSIALLKKEKSDSEKELAKKQQQQQPQVAAPTGDKSGDIERETKLKNAREIISNAIPRLGGGNSTSAIRRPPMPFGTNGRTPSGNLATGYSKPVRLGDVSASSSANNTPTTMPEHPPSFGGSSTKVGAEDNSTKTSRAEITLKSATLPRRKPAKTEISLDIQTKQMDPPTNTMRFNSELTHPVQGIQTAPIRETQPGFTASVTLQNRSNSVDPQKEYVVPLQRPPSYQRQSSSNYGLSRQSTNESNDSDTTVSQTLNTSASVSSTQQPIKKSPREFIIPIAVEGGGIVTPRASTDNIEHSESTATTNASTSSFASKRMGRPRKLGSLFNDDDDPISSFPSLKRHTSLGRESDTEEPRFHTMHRLRSSRPSKRPSTVSQEPNDSGSSGDEDDEDAFEILTAENLFSTLLSRVKALTQRANVNNDFTSNFPSSRLFDNMRQTRSPFWNHEPFGRLKYPTNITITTHANNNKSNFSIQLPSQVNYTITKETVTETKKKTRINNGAHQWRSTLSRDFQNDIDQMFARSGATTLPRVELRKTLSMSQKQPTTITHTIHRTKSTKSKTAKSSGNSKKTSNNSNNSSQQQSSNCDFSGCNGSGTEKNENVNADTNNNPPQVSLEGQSDAEEVLDLGDLDLSRLRLSKRDLETLSSITPTLSKKVQDQLLAQLPPTQAKKLSRTLSMLNNNTNSLGEDPKIYRRTHSTAAYDRNANDSRSDRDSLTPTNDVPPPITYTQPVYRRSMSRSRYDSTPDTTIASRERRGSSIARDIISPPSDYANKTFKYPTYGGATTKNYGKYSPYSSESSSYECEKSRELSPPISFYEPRRNSCLSPTKDFYGRPPSGCFSPPPISAENTLRRRSSTRRISRFLRPDFYDTPKEESAFVREKKEREKETQRVLREIRERSRDRAHDSSSRSEREATPKRDEEKTPNEKEHLRHLLNSVDSNIENLENQIRRRRSVSREPNGHALFEAGDNNPIKLTDRILDDLHNYTMLHKQKSQKSVAESSSREPSVPKEEKSLRKSKSKQNTPEVLQIIEDSDKKLKKESKLVRPKSYPSKEQQAQALKVKKQKSSDEILDASCINGRKEPDHIPTVSLPRPKSFASKMTPPKEIAKTATVADVNTSQKVIVKKKVKKDPVDVENSTPEPAKPIKKVRVIKKSKTDSSGKSTSEDRTDREATPVVVSKPAPEILKEKSPEKKPTKGFLTSIQQKFEKFRENTKANRVAKKVGATNVQPDVVNVAKEELRTSKSSSNMPNGKEKLSKTDKSNIDSMIRNLREQSVPRECQPLNESGLIKRAVSVEQMPDTFNKASVNRVLGLFKKIEKEKDQKGPKATKSTSYIASMGQNAKESRPKSFVSKIKKPSSSSNSESLVDTSTDTSSNVTNGKVPIKYTCPDCEQEAAATQNTIAKRFDATNATPEEKERKANNRKGLVLDFTKVKPVSSHQPVKGYQQTPSYENIANFSSDNLRSPGNSSNNFLSPGDEQDTCYDDWSSTCSDDVSSHPIISSSPSLSRLSRFSHYIGSTSFSQDDPNPENVLDRIRRRSFFPRFNEKKPRRVSTIVGPAAQREYYREREASVAAVTPRSTSKTRPQVDYSKSHASNLLPDYRANRFSTIDTRSPRKYYGAEAENGGLKVRNSTAAPFTGSSSGAFVSTTTPSYNSQKNRISSYSNGILPGAVSSAIDSYATLGSRKVRPYEHRTVSLLDAALSRRETEMGLERDDVLRSSTRSARQPSIPRSPTINDA
ncbi:uncharacterized protein LOC134835208 [Culicoides brevitarsis]|uniref:uncharacterized protein LOC134835208 n=1 Tax=Culicoides brevitarsis TaxID=469753 RepID=UPI00307BB5C6